MDKNKEFSDGGGWNGDKGRMTNHHIAGCSQEIETVPDKILYPQAPHGFQSGRKPLVAFLGLKLFIEMDKSSTIPLRKGADDDAFPRLAPEGVWHRRLTGLFHIFFLIKRSQTRCSFCAPATGGTRERTTRFSAKQRIYPPALPKCQKESDDRGQ